MGSDDNNGNLVSNESATAIINALYDFHLAFRFISQSMQCNFFFFSSFHVTVVVFFFHLDEHTYTPSTHTLAVMVRAHIHIRRVQLHAGWHVLRIGLARFGSPDKWIICEYHQRADETNKRATECTNGEHSFNAFIPISPMCFSLFEFLSIASFHRLSLALCRTLFILFALNIMCAFSVALTYTFGHILYLSPRDFSLQNDFADLIAVSLPHTFQSLCSFSLSVLASLLLPLSLLCVHSLAVSHTHTQPKRYLNIHIRTFSIIYTSSQTNEYTYSYSCTRLFNSHSPIIYGLCLSVSKKWT